MLKMYNSVGDDNRIYSFVFGIDLEFSKRYEWEWTTIIYVAQIISNLE